jgi:hypothetical protein
MRTLPILFSALAATGAAIAQDSGRPKFNRDVRPILSDKCFHCHGPDSKKREADLRLDVREAAIEGHAIIPGDTEASEIITRILSHDEDEVMPPPQSKLGRLTAQEIELLQRWIREGAEYEAHWSFIPLKPSAAPATQKPLDAHVTEGLAKRGLTLQPEATRETLIRRLSFDLTGLPPTPAEVSAFVNDNSPEAYEKLVDRLLQSPAYGERMAVDWLDMARYADSYGFQVDSSREVWPWRDWVIKAFNENLPYDKFVIWQLAGDLLPNPTNEQVMATAFNRLHQQESEGGSIEEEYRVEYVADRVQTFATAFLGLTFECARCHDHKFDPIPQKDYYQLFAMFQNVDEAGLYSFFTSSAPTPALPLMEDKAKRQLADLKAKIQVEAAKVAALRESQRQAFTDWLAGQPGEVSIGGELGRFSFDAMAGGMLENAMNSAEPATLRGQNKLVPGRRGNAIEFSGDDSVELAFGDFQRHEPFTLSMWLQTPDLKERAVILHRSRAAIDAASRGYELLIEDGRLKWSLIHFWPGNAISVRAKELLPQKEWVHVTVSYDGSSSAAGLLIYLNGKSMAVDVIKDALTKNISGGGGDHIHLGERFRDRGFKGGLMDDLQVFARELTAYEIARLPEGRSTLAIAAADISLFEHYLASYNAEWQGHRTTLRNLRAEEGRLSESQREIMVMRELPVPKKAYTLFRGEYSERRDEVFANTPEALPPMAPESPKNRLGLAQWLTSPQHPLFARVTVNRFWQALFGRGLVKTAEDFGSQGELPLYPEVLDSLSLSFMQSGWDVKALLKTIVMSQTYRQQSMASPQVMADDPENVWLARGPRFRLPAEMIRDNALAAAGLLKTQVGGPPVFSYEMSEAFKPVNASAGDGVYRRSLYSNWRRTSPPPAMVAFDAPRRAVCTAKRERTDSPLQALILLNGVQYVEAARVLGEKWIHENQGQVQPMIEQAFMVCLSRKPDAKESEILQQLYKEQLAHFQSHPQDAEALLAIGHAKRDASIAIPEAAAATVLAQTLMNHDACVVKR